LIVAGILIMVLFFGGLGSWAALAPLAGAAIGDGSVIVEGQRKSVEHRDGGIVSEILVIDGDAVRRGQILLRLDDTEARAALESATVQHDALKALEARLIAERDGLEKPVFDETLGGRGSTPSAAAMSNQLAVFEARKAQRAGEIAILRQKIAQLTEEIGGGQAQLRSKQQQSTLIEEEATGARTLFDQGYTPKLRLLALDRTRAWLEGEEGRLIGEMSRARQAIGEAELRILQLAKDRITEVANELQDTQTKLADLAPRLEAAREKLARTVLRAPVDGRVVGSTKFTIGGVIAPGGRVLDIVPEHDRLVVETRLNPEDIDGVAAGMAARVQLTGLALSRNPMLDGVVDFLSADRLVDETTKRPHYLARIRLQDDPRLAGGELYLQPGMPARVTIPTQPRTALDYLLEPLTSSLWRALRED
jgi:HlyD family type I secretion membrane fusion protein